LSDGQFLWFISLTSGPNQAAMVRQKYGSLNNYVPGELKHEFSMVASSVWGVKIAQ